MDRSKLLKNYTLLNNSFEKKLTFHLGADAGFFSEFNNMVLAMLYCLNKNIKFTLYSKRANFALSNGWKDFFIPFCEESDFFLHKRYNRRGYQIKNQKKFPPIVLKILTRNDYLTQDIWDFFRSEEFSKTRFTIPKLELEDASILDATQTIISMIWQYNAPSKQLVQEYKNSLKLPKNFISIHIRAGDKSLEADTFDIHRYMEKAFELKSSKKAFVLTDNYSVLEDLRKSHGDWEFYSLCQPSESGYVHSEFKKMEKHRKYLLHLKLFASLDICAASDKFVGTYSSNPGMFMGMRMGEDKCTCIDYDSWKLW